MDLSVLSIVIFLVTGVASGLAAGLMGVGGGLINVPALYYVFQTLGYPQEHCLHMALGTSLAIIIFTSTSSARTHYKKGNLIPRVALTAGVGGVLGALAASLIAVRLSDTILRIAFALFLYLAAARLILNKQPEADTTEADFRLGFPLLAAIGLGSGILSGFFGIGGGLIGVPLFILAAKLTPHKAVGSSSGMVVILAIFGALGYAFSTPPVPLANTFGFVQIPAWILVASSSILSAHFGAVIASKVSSKKLTIIFVIGLVLVATKMLLG